jgi:FixJ family two-component response regulator
MHCSHSISVVDDDRSVRGGLEILFKSMGFKVRTFESAEVFLASNAISSTDCLILDVHLNGMSGPDLQREILAMRHSTPIVFITAHGDDSIRSRVIAEGAVECLFKPCSEEELLSAVDKALRWGRNGDRAA